MQHLILSWSFKHKLFYVQMPSQCMSTARKSSSPTPLSHNQMPANTSSCKSNRHLEFHISEAMPTHFLHPYSPPPPVHGNSILPLLNSKTLTSSLTVLPNIQSSRKSQWFYHKNKSRICSLHCYGYSPSHHLLSKCNLLPRSP